MRVIGIVLVSIFLMSNSGPAIAAGSEPVATEVGEIGQARDALKGGDFAAAEALLRKAVAKDPGSADAWNLLGFATRKQEKLKEAEEYYLKALAIDSKHIGAMEYLGILYVKTGRLEEANAMLARIDKACFFTCEEYTDLKAGIDTGKPK
ncbi:MAG: tetratricopeptide repeat protein [Rhodospirillales bacterium]